MTPAEIAALVKRKQDEAYARAVRANHKRPTYEAEHERKMAEALKVSGQSGG